mgnify:CR=1 FL=1
MPKLKTYGVITEDELKQAKQAGRFLIAENVTCSYCHQPVSIDTDTRYLYCPQHYQLALSMYWYPDYPAVPMDAPRYKEMHFHLSQLARNQTLFDNTPRKDIATEKGCPFCERYLTPVDPSIEGQRDMSLLNQKMSCPECGVSFLIEVIAPTGRETDGLQLRFTPDATRLKDTPTQHTDVEHDAQPIANTPQEVADVSRADTEQETLHSHDDATADTENLPQSQPNAIETLIDEHPNRHTDIAGQIVAYLTDAENHTAGTAEMRTAIGCTTEGFNKARKKLIDAGQIRQRQRGVYQLIHHP